MYELFQVDRWSEWMDSVDWNEQRASPDVKSISHDPSCVLPSGVSVCWAFGTKSEELVFLHADVVGKVSLEGSKLQLRRNSQFSYFVFAECIYDLSSSGNFSIEKLIEEFDKNKHRNIATDEDYERIKSVCESGEFVVTSHDGVRIVSCFKSFDAASGPMIKSPAALGSILQLSLFRYLQMNPICKLVPSKYFSLRDKTPDEIFKQYWTPKLFDPNTECNEWNWPWQHMDQAPDITSREIETVSMCIDIRSSTKTMELTEKKSSFAKFIREITSEMREICIDGGAFFDKETGDGVVVHFLGNSDESGASQAFSVGKKISAKCGETCMKFVDENLSHRILIGVGVGIHTGPAHWFVSDDQIMAIGDSVIGATRICSVAKPNQMLMSLAAWRMSEKCRSGQKAKLINKVEVDVKGIEPPTEAFLVE